MTQSAKQIANKLIELAQRANNPLTPMQLIKLVYICHGWMLGLYGRPLIKESVLAWRYGPVISSLYGDLKKYGSGHVTEKLRVPDTQLDEIEADLVEQVFEKYSHLSGVALSRLTHAEDTPWDKTWRGAGQNAVISTDLIEEHYSSKAQGAN